MFTSRNSDLFLSELWDCKLAQLRVIMSELQDFSCNSDLFSQNCEIINSTNCELYSPILRRKQRLCSQNCQFISHNSLYFSECEFISQFWLKTHNCEFISQFWGKKSQNLKTVCIAQILEKSENCEIEKVTITFFIFYSVRKRASIELIFAK